MNTETKTGHVAIVGRPNVGKSTLMNFLIGQKISITSPKPQTTRHTIVGIRTDPHVQQIYVDTPGLHLHEKRAMNRFMNRSAVGALSFVDVIVFVVEALQWTDEDIAVVNRLQHYDKPVILAISKVDLVSDKTRLLPFIQEMEKHYAYATIVPLSAKKESNLQALVDEISVHLPEQPFIFSEDDITTASRAFIAAELVREKLTKILHDELPYALTVEIENYEIVKGIHRIAAIIWVEREGQKGIVIGQNGALLREAGRQAREDMEKIFDSKVFLQTWVKVRSGWQDDERALHSLGYQLKKDI